MQKIRCHISPLCSLWFEAAVWFETRFRQYLMKGKNHFFSSRNRSKLMIGQFWTRFSNCQVKNFVRFGFCVDVWLVCSLFISFNRLFLAMFNFDVKLFLWWHCTNVYRPACVSGMFMLNIYWSKCRKLVEFTKCKTKSRLCSIRTVFKRQTMTLHRNRYPNKRPMEILLCQHRIATECILRQTSIKSLEASERGTGKWVRRRVWPEEITRSEQRYYVTITHVFHTMPHWRFDAVQRHNCWHIVLMVHTIYMRIAFVGAMIKNCECAKTRTRNIHSRHE